MQDTRAVRVGDLVEIVVSETADASGTASTALSKSSTATMGLPNLLGVMAQIQKANPNIDPSDAALLRLPVGLYGHGQHGTERYAHRQYRSSSHA